MDQFDVEKFKEGAEKVKDGAEKALEGGKSFWNGLNSFFNFNNPGQKLKRFVVTLNKINLALTLIAFVGWFFAGFFAELIYYAFLLYVVGFIGIIVYYVLSYLSCLFLYAFAEMVENSTILANKE